MYRANQGWTWDVLTQVLFVKLREKYDSIHLDATERIPDLRCCDIELAWISSPGTKRAPLFKQDLPRAPHRQIKLALTWVC